MVEEMKANAVAVRQSLNQRAFLALNKLNDDEREAFTQWVNEAPGSRLLTDWPMWPEVFRRISQ